ncbi:hypothetical protein BMS3Bbin08_00130 [bacterium BMS3Bbin08]|nr:hypothetical protein BMS3Bbin08_00130 [bacterium BMS3Bbin08]
MSFDKLCTLYKHSTRAACRVEDAAVIRLYHLNDELDDRSGCEELTAPLSLAHGELAEKVFVNPPEHIPFDIHRYIVKELQEGYKHLVFELAVCFRENALELFILLFNRLHGIVYSFAYVSPLRQFQEV